MAEPGATAPPSRPREANADESRVDFYGLTPTLIEAVEEALDDGSLDRIKALVVPLHAADMADLLEMVTSDERRIIVEVLRPEVDPAVLAALGETVRNEIVEILSTAELATAVTRLDTDDAVYLIEDLDKAEQRELLAAVPTKDRVVLEEGLAYPENSAGRLMQRDLIAVPQHWPIGKLIDYMRSSDDLPDEFYDIFVIDSQHRPIGYVPLSRVLRSRRPVLVKGCMESNIKAVSATLDQEDVAYLFNQYDLVSAPVVNNNGRLIGVITVDDVVEVIRDEGEEDIMRLGGVIETDLHEPAWRTSRRRFVWLLVNLATAILASLVIGLFDASIAQMVALAVLMPIVASMGGNAGTQALTVTVRALATKDVTAANTSRLIGKESVVGLVNGTIFAGIVGLVTFFWFGDIRLSIVIAAAMVVNMVVAGFFGILIPLGLGRIGIDPAIAATVLLTTITDVVGFFIFLGLAALVLL